MILDKGFWVLDQGSPWKKRSLIFPHPVSGTARLFFSLQPASAV
jgi:hypothetical protein